MDDAIKSLNISGHRVHDIEPHKMFEIGSLKILPFPGEHDVPIVNFLIESIYGGKMVYLTDVFYCRFKFKNVNIFAIEANYSKEILDKNVSSGEVSEFLKNRIIKSHFSLDNVKEFFKANDLSSCREIHLIHLSSTNSNAELFKNEVQKLTGIPTFIGGQ